MCEISKEAFKKCYIEVTDDDKYFWIKRKDLEIESDYKNWPQIFDKCDVEKPKYRSELMHSPEYQPCRVFARNDLVEKKIKRRRLPSQKFLEFIKKLGLDP